MKVNGLHGGGELYLEEDLHWVGGRAVLGRVEGEIYFRGLGMWAGEEDFGLGGR